MAKQIINIGSSANKGDGEPLRTAFDKINDNFNELYLKVDNLILNNSNEVFLVDKVSTLQINGKRIFGNLEGKNIEGMMYGNLYGKQTKR